MDVNKLLEQKGIDYEEKGNDYIVSCLNPEHIDSNPSLRIDRDTGKYNCFSCGFRGDIFDHFGEYRSRTYDLLYEVESLIDNIMLEARGLEIPESAVAFTGAYRGIRPETYKKFNAFTHTDPEFADRIVIPIYSVSDNIPAFIGRYMFSQATPKYRVYPPSANIPIYPVPYGDTAIFVEGIFDVINLHDKGVEEACAIFGTHTITWKTVEDKLAPLMAAGVTRIVLLLDGDSAGKNSTRKLTSMIEAKTDLRVFDASGLLPEGEDPGSLSQDEVTLLHKYIKKLIANNA